MKSIFEPCILHINSPNQGTPKQSAADQINHPPIKSTNKTYNLFHEKGSSLIKLL